MFTFGIEAADITTWMRCSSGKRMAKLVVVGLIQNNDFTRLQLPSPVIYIVHNSDIEYEYFFSFNLQKKNDNMILQPFHRVLCSCITF